MSRTETSYLILLEGILSSPESIQDAINLAEPPRAVQAASGTQEAIFCIIDGNIKQSIETWLWRQKSTLRPIFVRLSKGKAKKNLVANSMYPTLGLESTLPQHRFSSSLSFDPTLPQHRGSSSNIRICSPKMNNPYGTFFMAHSPILFSWPASCHYLENFSRWCKLLFQKA